MSIHQNAHDGQNKHIVANFNFVSGTTCKMGHVATHPRASTPAGTYLIKLFILG